MTVSTQGISEIIPQKLYLGDIEGSRNLEELKRLGVTHILNLSPRINNHYDKNFTYLKIAVEDCVKGISVHFPKAFTFIENGEVVFVHCRKGVSRSATIVISYLMKKKQWNYNDALTFVKDKRSKAKPHFVFKEELILFEKQLASREEQE